MSVDADLGDLLAKVLPRGVELTVRHVSSTPIPSPALFAAAPGQDTEPTFCENHFLTISIDRAGDNGGEIIVFGMEVMVYNTAHLTTIFVSKADSTGLLHLLELPRKVSVLRLVSTTFLSFLTRTRQRPGVRLVVSLFARAQNQYLFSGSIENPNKHVLDDRGLIKWWCRTLDPILREQEPESVFSETKRLGQTAEAATASATAYLIVPGCDKFETRTFFPTTAKSDPQDCPRWLNSYPLHQLCPDPKAPPRCLVPRLPDDPKTRFLIDLDDELPEPAEGENSPPNNGQWRSVRSLDQFWEMMSFRQECSAGRLVGFLWLVVNPPGLLNSISMASQTRSLAEAGQVNKGATGSKDASNHDEQLASSSLDAPIDASVSFPNTVSASEQQRQQTNTTSPFGHHPVGSSAELRSKGQAADANPFYWPEAGRGHVVLSDGDYKKMMNSFLDSFYDEKEAVASTKTYVNHVACLADQLLWGKRIVGNSTPETSSTQSLQPSNVLDRGLVRKRKKPDAEAGKTAAAEGEQVSSRSQDTSPGVNMLNASLIRKKKKT
ncbi:hypothetical protein N7474_000190 [Penicillium riverlandense]|uniref:uncharacterized protein n=1 Tax=Penicillium riverlandense TaxID=1903569 RepID=UPI0025467368|nr:uncharacterized protein N7474_000190 [Penicillium riverlandense]KAJ5831879.1 hypothetical protein N7474_000190 [Penicillium riverlandense]